MRLGAYEAVLSKGSLAEKVYGARSVQERHRHRYEVNVHYRERLEHAGLKFSGMSPDKSYPRLWKFRRIHGSWVCSFILN